MTVDLNKLKIGDKAKVIYVGADVDMICVGDIVTVISNDESGYLNYKIELDGDKNSNYEPYWAGIEPRPDLGCSTDAYIQIEKYEEQEKPAQNIGKTMLEKYIESKVDKIHEKLLNEALETMYEIRRIIEDTQISNADALIKIHNLLPKE